MKLHEAFIDVFVLLVVKFEIFFDFVLLFQDVLHVYLSEVALIVRQRVFDLNPPFKFLHFCKSTASNKMVPSFVDRIKDCEKVESQRTCVY